MYTQYYTAPLLRVSSPLSPSRSVPSIYVSSADSPVRTDASMEPDSPEESLSSRSNHLFPPPVGSLHQRKLSPAKAMDKKGLDQATFQGLLNANRERSSRRLVSPADRLRREVVVKAHHSKQLERRALFLSRIIAPPSPTSTETAVTPPESPAIFHFSLPSPGLESPLELFETVTSRERWIEEVDYNKKSLRTSARDLFPTGRLPSLDQITARLRPTLNTTQAIPSIVVRSPTPVSVKPLNIIKGDRQDEVKPRLRIPDRIIASARARSASPPTPVAPVAPISDASKLIIPTSPPKSIKSVLVPQSIPALRVNKPSGPELAPVPVMSWRERAAARSPSVAKEHLQAESWRREVPVKKELVRDAVISSISSQLPIGTKPALPISRETRSKIASQPQASVHAPVTPARNKATEGVLNMDANGAVDGIAVSRRSALLRLQHSATGASKLTETERRAVQGRNMVDKLRRRTSAPAELEGLLKKGIPVGGF